MTSSERQAEQPPLSERNAKAKRGTAIRNGGGSISPRRSEATIGDQHRTEVERLLREFGAVSEDKIAAATDRAHSLALVRELLAYATSQGLGPGLVLKMLIGDIDIPEAVRSKANRRSRVQITPADLKRFSDLNQTQQAAALASAKARYAESWHHWEPTVHDDFAVREAKRLGMFDEQADAVPAPKAAPYRD